MNQGSPDMLKARKLPKMTRVMSNDTAVNLKGHLPTKGGAVLSVKKNNDYSRLKHIIYKHL